MLRAVPHGQFLYVGEAVGGWVGPSVGLAVVLQEHEPGSENEPGGHAAQASTQSAPTPGLKVLAAQGAHTSPSR